MGRMNLEFTTLKNTKPNTTSAVCKPGHGWGDDAEHCGPPGQNKK